MADKESGNRQLTPSFIASSDEVFDLYCEACAEDDKHLEAKGFCVDCRDYLCEDCVQSHGKSRVSRNHAVQDKSQMPRQKPPAPAVIPSKSSSSEKCEKHPSRLIEYYCKDDNSLGCTVCMTVKHRQCQEVDLISDCSKQLLDSQNYQKFACSLTTLKTQSQDIIKSAKDNTIHAEKLGFDLAHALQTLRGKVILAFDKLEGNIQKKIETIKTADVKKMKDICDTGIDVLDEVDKIYADVQALKNDNQLGQLFVKMIKLEDRVETLHTLLHQADANNSVTTYKLEPGTGIYQIVDDPTCIAKLSVSSTVNKESTDQKKSAAKRTPSSTKKPPPRPAAPKVKAPTPVTDTHSGDLKAVQVNDITVRTTTDDENCRISGSILLPNDKMILVDTENYKIKLLNLQTSKVTSELKPSSMPWDVAKITGDQDVAVTLRYAKKIAFVKVTPELKLDREMPVGGDCTAILHNNGKLIIAFCDTPKIEIMTLDGTVERTIECSNMLKGASKMSLSPGYDAIYVSDTSSNCVKRLSLGGVIESEYKDKQLRYPRDLIVDQYGRVLVCGATSSGNIHVLTPDLIKIKVLVEGLSWPSSLSLCHNKNRLYVGRAGDSMCVYQLS